MITVVLRVRVEGEEGVKDAEGEEFSELEGEGVNARDGKRKGKWWTRMWTL